LPTPSMLLFYLLHLKNNSGNPPPQFIQEIEE
jgi:hypothetical protein